MTKRCMIKVFRVVCPAGSDDSCKEFLDDLGRRMSRLPVLMIRFLCCLFYWLPFLIVRRLRTATNLNDHDRERYIAWWEKNRSYNIREAFNSIKTVSLLARVGKDWEP
jgi:hypothetical protein